MKRKLTLGLMSLLAMMLILAACGGNAENEQNNDDNSDYSVHVKENPIVTITMENDEQIVIELEPKKAPNTVANFISLVQKGYYDGVIFHRVIPDFMIQGGDPTGTGAGGPGYTIQEEIKSNGFDNDIAHEYGVISMAHTGAPNSTGSQFFIVLDNSSHLDGVHPAFGRVIEGMDVVEAIANVERDRYNDKPLQDQVMKKVEVDTKGFDYPEPKIIK